MNLNYLKKQQTIFLGLGAENFFLILWLRAKGLSHKITIWDVLSKEKLGERYKFLANDKNIDWIFSKKLPDLKNYSLIVRSPGVFIKPAERKKLNHKLIGPIQLFIDFCPTKNIIGVTGTKGKGTTSSLIYTILKTAKKRVWLGGNIGVAPFSFINQVRPADWVILELSSFQLQEIKQGPKIAVFTNFSPEHLAPADPNNPNYHSSLKEYWEAKMNITKATKLLVINKKLKSRLRSVSFGGQAKIKSPLSRGQKTKIKYFTSSDLKSNLPGEHNKENVAAATAVAKHLKIPERTIIKAVKSFKGLEYRLEKIADKKGVLYYNDSFATTPEATEIALKSFSAPIILLAGGANKKSDFRELAKMVVKKVKYLILFHGAGTPRLKQAVTKAGFKNKNIILVHSMTKAIKIAKLKAIKGDIVLMSPACASFGMFKNYKDRGKQFTKLVNKK